MAIGKTLEELQAMGAKPVAKTGGLTLEQLQAMQKPKGEGYMQRVKSQYEAGAQSAIEGATKGAEAYQAGVNKGTFKGVLQATGGLLRSGLRSAGAVAGAALAPITEAPIIRSVVGKIGERLAADPGVSRIITQASEISKKYPEAAKDIQNIIDIVTLEGGKAVEAPLAAEGKAIGQDIASGVRVALSPSEEAVQKKVVDLFNRSIKPTTKKTLAQGEKYENNILGALKTIRQNADQLNIEDATGELVTGRTPQTLNELAQGVDQTKDIIFKQYDTLAKQANGAGATIDAKAIAGELDKVAQSKSLQLVNPDIIKYAENWSTRLKSFNVLDTETTQEVVKLMNKNLEAFYRNPTYDAATKVAVDAGIANNFRQALDKAIEGATGQQYQALKNQYGALKAIEQDVTRAAMRDAKRNVKGLLDYTDIFTSGQMVGGILSLNPAMFTKGAVERGFKEYIKFLNDPNRAIGNIFKQLDKNVSSEVFTPKSATGKSIKEFIKDPKLGASVQAINPENVAKKIDGRDLQLMRDYVNKGDINSFMRAQPLINELQLGSMDEKTLQRFMKEVLDLSTRKLKVK